MSKKVAHSDTEMQSHKTKRKGMRPPMGASPIQGNSLPKMQISILAGKKEKVKTITLFHGSLAIVDEDDFEELNSCSWCETSNGFTTYAATGVRNGKSTKRVWMHRKIMNAKPGEYVDHINHNTLDNRKSNLRLCTAPQNASNSRLNKNNNTGFKGVTFIKKRGKWAARARGGTRHLGYFSSPEEAAIKYDQVAVERYGKFALTNQSLGLLPKCKSATRHYPTEEEALEKAAKTQRKKVKL